MAKTYLDYISALTNGVQVFASEPGNGFVGTLFAVMANTIAQGLSEAFASPLLTRAEQPTDALPRLAAERMMPRYPSETAAQHQARLIGAWDAYQYAGHKTAIVSQLEAAGFVGTDEDPVTIYTPATLVKEPLLDMNGDPWWSQFWVYFPYGSHPVTEPAVTWGSFNWGDGTIWGPPVEPATVFATIRGIIRKWKPVDWVCHGIIFQLADDSLVEIGA